MAAAAAGIWNSHLAAGQGLDHHGAKPMSGPATGTGGTDPTTSDPSSGDSSTISANDFLTLLVTEMQNQDPTADTDPNEYINQLVQVNSLEQLIDINQNLSSALGTSGTTSSSGTASDAKIPGTSPASKLSPAHSASHRNGPAAVAGATSASTGASGIAGLQSPARGTKYAPGNLSVPADRPAAHRVAQSLNGRPHHS